MPSLCYIHYSEDPSLYFLKIIRLLLSCTLWLAVINRFVLTIWGKTFTPYHNFYQIEETARNKRLTSDMYQCFERHDYTLILMCRFESVFPLFFFLVNIFPLFLSGVLIPNNLKYLCYFCVNVLILLLEGILLFIGPLKYMCKFFNSFCCLY